MKDEYVSVECVRCGAALGFVWSKGHRDWLCPTCAHRDRPKAIDADDAAWIALAKDAARDGDPFPEE